MDLNDGRVVSNFSVQALKNEPITIYGDGTQTRSFCYVTDLIPGLIALMETTGDVTGPINLGNPNEFTMLELATKITAAASSRSEVVFLDLPADDPKQRKPDIGKARNLLGWEPKVQLDEGLSNTIRYFASQIQNS
jgi:UDP-glucuronate decarboxylase